MLLSAAVALRPTEELYDIVNDPGCLNNLANSDAAQAIKHRLSSELDSYLARTGDLRQTDPKAADIWETYPRVSRIRWFPIPSWAKQNPAKIPVQSWLDQRRPRDR
jgi:uncharacterized sulfatase